MIAEEIIKGEMILLEQKGSAFAELYYGSLQNMSGEYILRMSFESIQNVSLDGVRTVDMVTLLRASGFNMLNLL